MQGKDSCAGFVVMVGLAESTALFLRSIRHTAVLDAIDVVEVFNHAAVVGDADNGTAFFAGDLAKQCHHTFTALGIERGLQFGHLETVKPGEILDF